MSTLPTSTEVKISLEAKDTFRAVVELEEAAASLTSDIDKLREEEKTFLRALSAVRKEIQMKEAQRVACLSLVQVINDRVLSAAKISNFVHQHHRAGYLID